MDTRFKWEDQLTASLTCSSMITTTTMMHPWGLLNSLPITQEMTVTQLAAGILGLNQTHHCQGYTTLDCEVQRYYDIECGEDMLTYWQVSLHLFLTMVTISQFMTQEHCNQYPTILKLVMDILPIQGSAMPCE